MNTEERSILENFLNQLAQVRGINKDPEAERLIQQGFERQPDAPYLLVQRALLLSQALEQAKARLAELEEQQVESSRGFLDPAASGWASPDAQRPYGAAPGTAAFTRPAAPSSQYPPVNPGVPVYAPYAAPPSVPPMGGGMSSFLGQAAATAAGVAGGAFLFEGIEHLLGGHHGTPFMEQVPAGFPPEEVTVNNYYYPQEPRQDNSPDDISIDDIRDPGMDNYADDNPANDEDFV